MKKKLTLLLIAVIVKVGGQQPISDINFGDLPRPVPSVSSLINYTDAPVSLTTGVPDIKLPLLEISSGDKNILTSLVLQYHPLNINGTEAGSEVGIGWSMFAGGVISREVVNEPDEIYDDMTWVGYKKNKFNDIYYYNLPGISGKFKIERDTDNNTFQIVNLTSDNIKIEYTRNSNASTLIINSFILTDDNGYRYIFNDYSQSRSYTHPQTSGTLFKSAFYLSHIKNQDNVGLLNFTYQKDYKNKPGSGELLYQFCKLKNILSPGKGSIVIEYNYDVSLEGTMNDPYSITKISLKDNSGKVSAQYSLKCDLHIESKRTLTGINKINLLNPAGPPLEKTQLLYTTYHFNNTSKEDCTAVETGQNSEIGTLYKVILPTGGVVEYNFEANQYYQNKNIPGYITPETFSDPELQFIHAFEVMDFDTHVTKNYTFQVTGEPNKPKKIYVQFTADKYNPVFTTTDPESFVDYMIDNIPNLNICYKFNDKELEGRTWSSKTLFLMPGTHSLTITGTGGRGTITLSDIGSKPAPYPNAVSNDIKLGIRIKDIKYYNSALDTQPKKTVSYEYSAFNDPNSSSGSRFFPETESQSTESTPVVLYKNVKVTNDSGNGYINYYFKNSNDYPKVPYTHNGINTTFWPYYNLIKTGVMEKKEVFNNQNQLVSSVNYDFTFETLNQMPEVSIQGGYTKNAYIKNTKVVTKDYSGTDRFVESKVETEFNPSNFKVASVKETLSDGNITEKVVTYCGGSAGYQNLESAYMTGIPVKTEVKNNGKLVSDITVKYENTDNLYPSSILSINPNDNSSKVIIKYDDYDSRGNVRQFTSGYNAATGAGTPTVIIWGYNQSFPIAKIEGAKLADIGNLADDIILKSNADTDAASETTLINLLDSFRTNAALKNFSITTFTYDPLVGVTTVTPPGGLREIYKYDTNGRLISVVDVNGNLITENKYNTRPQL